MWASVTSCGYSTPSFQVPEDEGQCNMHNLSTPDLHALPDVIPCVPHLDYRCYFTLFFS